MSDILIKGMKMPRGEDEGVLIALYDGQAYHIGTKEKHEAIELPPHGDLIDRDALEQDAQKRLLMCNKNDNHFQRPYEVIREIALAPTIIPAEPPKEE